MLRQDKNKIQFYARVGTISFAIGAWLLGSVLPLSQFSPNARLLIAAILGVLGVIMISDWLSYIGRVIWWNIKWTIDDAYRWIGRLREPFEVGYGAFDHHAGFYIPRASDISDAYLKTLFGYYGRRLSESEPYATKLTLRKGLWAVGFNIVIAERNDVILLRDLRVGTTDKHIAEVLALPDALRADWKTGSIGDDVEHFPHTVRKGQHTLGKYLIEAKERGSCRFVIQYDLEGNAQEEAIALSLEIV